MPAYFTWANGGESVGLIPTRYPGSEASPDPEVRRSRRTEWLEQPGGAYVGQGQRMFFTDSGEYPLMEVRRIAFETRPTRSRPGPRRAKPLAELTPKERLQPSLLDRLTDNEPEKTQESREQRVFAVTRLREAVLRDLAWLLNTTNLAAGQDLGAYPQVASSVLNYGIPDLSGMTVSGTDVAVLERALRQAIIGLRAAHPAPDAEGAAGDQREPDEPQRHDVPDRGRAVGAAGAAAPVSQDRDRPRDRRRQGRGQAA